MSVPWNAPIVHSMSEGKFTVKYLRSRGSHIYTTPHASGNTARIGVTRLSARPLTDILIPDGRHACALPINIILPAPARHEKAAQRLPERRGVGGTNQ